MPSWKKVILSGSDAALNSLTVTNGITGSLFGTASYATVAANGGVTQLLAGPNITLAPTNGLGQVTVSAAGGGGSSFNTATGSYGSFYDTTTQTNPVANTPRSMSLNTTDITNGVSISGSTNPYNTYIKTENAGVYDIQFSAQLDKTDAGKDEILIWLRKNGIDLTDTATTVTLTNNNDKVVAAWNWFVNSAANDYYQIIWYSPDTNIRLLAETAGGGHPGIPSVIVTANRVDQFLSNTGSFSGSFTGQFTGSLFGTASFATSASFASTASFLNSTTNAFIQNGNSFGALALLGTNDNQSLALETNGTTRMFISSSGNVGINKTTPNATLDVNGNTIITGSLAQGSGSRATGTGSHAEGRNTLASGIYSHAEGLYTTASTQYSHAEGLSTLAIGSFAHAEGRETLAQGDYAHAEGGFTTASANYSHAEGGETRAIGDYSHTEGYQTIANGAFSHAEGRSATSTGNYSHAEGEGTQATGEVSHTEGSYTTTIGSYSHAEGQNTIAYGASSHAEGLGTKTGTEYAFYSNSISSGVITLSSVYGDISSIFVAGNPLIYSDIGYDETYGITTFTIDSVTWDGTNTIITLTDTSVNGSEAVCGDLIQINNWSSSGGDRNINANYSHAEGASTSTFGYYSHAEGRYSITSGDYSHAEGQDTISIGNYSHAEGRQTKAIGEASHAEGESTKAVGDYSHAEGHLSIATGQYGHVEGYLTTASGDYSHAEGYETVSIGEISHAEGRSTAAIGRGSHTEGYYTTASGDYSHAEGTGTISYGAYSHAEGSYTSAPGDYSHAEGNQTTAKGDFSHAEGESTIAIGVASHAAGFSTSASGDYQSVIGRFNIPSSAQSAFIIGNGTAEGSRSNLLYASGSNVQITGSLIATQGITGSLFGTSSFASTASFAPLYLPLTGGTISGNLTIIGTASFSYVSQSTLNIGTNLITVNTFNPTSRFGGLAVIDSGSSPLVSASFLYDSVQDEFIFVHKGTVAGAITSSVFLLGPETYNNLGNETYLTANRIPKGTGIEHLNDSNISDNGSVVTINSNTQITGSTIITGSLRGNVSALFVSSNTASLDLTTNNFFTINLSNSTNIHISASNIQPGQTINLRVSQSSAGTGTVSFNSLIEQASGSLYTGSMIANAEDIVTFISFDSSRLYASAIRNLV